MPNCPQIECFTITIIYLAHDSACWLFGFIQQGFQEGLGCTHSICNHYWPPGGFGSGGDWLSNMCVWCACICVCLCVCVRQPSISAQPRLHMVVQVSNHEVGNCVASGILNLEIVQGHFSTSVDVIIARPTQI